MRRFKKIILGLVFFMLAFAGYVEIANRNTSNMTYRQKLLKAVYPAWMWFAKLRGKGREIENEKKSAPMVSFYTLKAQLNNGQDFDFTQLKGKKVLIVNTASDCGYTNQYDDLQKLHQQFPGKLVVLGFPANDFKEQEKGSDEEIASFCKVNFGVTFPLMRKSTVVKGDQQNAVFQWLSDSTKNGWNQQAPTWNFSKYLIDENGNLSNYFDPAVSPTSEDVIKSIEKN